MLYRIICSKEANTFKINVIVMESEAVRPPLHGIPDGSISLFVYRSIPSWKLESKCSTITLRSIRLVSRHTNPHTDTV